MVYTFIICTSASRVVYANYIIHLLWFDISSVNFINVMEERKTIKNEFSNKLYY